MGSRQGSRRWWALALALLLAASALPALGAPLVLAADRQPVALHDAGDAWIDDGADASVEAVAADPAIRWEPTHDGAIYQLSTGKALWLRFTVAPAPGVERWYLEIPYPSVNRASLYAPDAAGRWQAQHAGDSIAVSAWPVPHRHPLLPLQVSAAAPRQYLLRVENPHSFSAPLAFVSEGALNWREQRVSLVLGIYFGLAALTAALSLLGAASLRDTAYAMYAVSVLLMALSQAALTGISGLHLWPGLPWWNDVSPLVLPVLALGALLCFFAEMVSMAERSLLLYRAAMGLALLSLVAAAGLMLVEPSQRYRIMVGSIMAGTGAIVASLLWALRRGDRLAPWLLVGSLPVIAGAAFPLAALAGVLPASVWSRHAMQLGIAVELPTLLLILMMRSQQRREHHRRMQGLDRMDPATGLLNAPVFADRLMRMMARSERLNYRSAVLLVDVVNVEQVRREFGPRAAEELPLRVAGRLLATAREIDEVARITPLRFGILVEGPLTPDEAASLGPRMVARCLMPFKDKPIGWIAQVRVGQTLVPGERSAKDVLLGLEALLASVGPDSKRAVFTLR